MNILTFTLITIIFQAAVFSIAIIARRFGKTIRKFVGGRLSIGTIVAILGGIVVFALKIFSNQWVLFYIVNFALVVIGIGIWMLIDKRKRNRIEEKHIKANANESSN